MEATFTTIGRRSGAQIPLSRRSRQPSGRRTPRAALLSREEA